MKTRPSYSRLLVPTTWGVIEVLACGGRITACHLPVHAHPPAAELKGRGRLEVKAFGADARVLRKAGRFVLAALAGRSAECPPLLDLGGGAFVQRARAALRRVRRGTTCSYGELAAAAGSPRAARAAGSACATNPLPLFIPCHRVLASGGRLGGFSGGLAWKKLLLEREGAAVPRGGRA